jgi:hypothetical protein
MKEYTEQEKQKMAVGVLRFLEINERSKKLSDIELVEQVVDKVWGTAFNLGSWEEQLLDELITRFENQVGIERDDEGRIIKPTPPAVSGERGQA